VYSKVDEPAPKCKRFLTEKAKKKKGRKGNGIMAVGDASWKDLVDLENYEYPGRKLTESDEEMEARMKNQTQEDEYELETQFTEKF